MFWAALLELEMSADVRACASKGDGTMEWGDDRRYAGQWRANQMTGMGALRAPRLRK